MDLKFLLMVLVSHGISAGLSKTVAAQKARNSNRWLLAGLLFGPLGLIAAVGLPDRHQIVYLRYLAEQQGYQPRHVCGGQKPDTEA
ncbi:hypothetical protein KR52_08620 [Synechococcus sp. KORDI-52]|uniref:hypothetical protein n=1 Tax=Synechococcus sp. KORDI-52 TaxID=585425 RepID=UPI0004E02F8D|nr:hypothetical protein [Synechococcus sp. KORDI-52]AII49205.1 hypothetical protein KR52_08620 [Synechococcus sp. KORDI-52]